MLFSCKTIQLNLLLFREQKLPTSSHESVKTSTDYIYIYIYIYIVLSAVSYIYIYIYIYISRTIKDDASILCYSEFRA